MPARSPDDRPGSRPPPRAATPSCRRRRRPRAACAGRRRSAVQRRPQLTDRPANVGKEGVVADATAVRGFGKTRCGAVCGQQAGQVLHDLARDVERGSIGDQPEASGGYGHDLVVRPVLPGPSHLSPPGCALSRLLHMGWSISLCVDESRAKGGAPTSRRSGSCWRNPSADDMVRGRRKARGARPVINT
jgi:hypothetical protein